MTSSGSQFVLGQYKIGKPIGQGTFGKVRLGIHIPSEQKVAVKTLQKEKIVDQADIERVTRQICILKVLRHPNVIQLYEIIETKTDIHLIMEYAEGGQLFDYIVKKKRLDEKEAVSFMQQILSGVEYIHKNGIVHRDLKPQNLLLDHNKNIKIVDFGLSNHYKPGQKLKTACGSPCYAAPQMIAGKRYQCLGADIWSCGIILYAMLCGYLPFQDPNTNKLYKKIMAGQYQAPKILTADSKAVLKGILNTNPQTRFKIEQVRQSKWFNQLPNVYQAPGIIVGKDLIEPQQAILRKMQKYNADIAQSKNYIVNNRHNEITALYYLLKIRSQKDPHFLQEQQKTDPKVQKREQSPLIYKPDAKRDYYIPIKKPSNRENKDSSKNDSMNASNIISSLVEANKNRLVAKNRFANPTKKQTYFEKLEEFKLFPDKKNSSIYQPTPSKGGSTSREKSIQFNRLQKSIDETSYKATISIQKQGGSLQNTLKNNEESTHKKRQELSQQLKQISLKIDKEISELRKQNNIGQNTPKSSLSKNRQSFGPTISNTSRPKTQQNSIGLKATNFSASSSKDNYLNQSKDYLNTSRDSINLSKDTTNTKNNQTAVTQFSSSKQRFNFNKERENRQQVPSKNPKIHNGPFNTQCIFMENAKILFSKVVSALSKLKLTYKQIDSYSVSMVGNQQISIQSIQGIEGLHLIKFNGQHPANQSIIEVLSR